MRRGSWFKYASDEGLPYYFDVDTNVSQWERPADYVSDGEEVTDNTSTTPYYQSNDGLVLEISQETSANTIGYYEQSNNYSFESALEYTYDSSNHFTTEMNRYIASIQYISPSIVYSVDWYSTCTRSLEMLQWLLQNCGTEQEWKAVLRSQGFSIVKCLLHFVNESVEPTLVDNAIRCFAFSFMVYNNLWHAYSQTQDSSATMIRLLSVSSQRIVDLLAKGSSSSVRTGDPYVGYDERDMKDFNVQGRDVIEGTGELGSTSDSDIATYLLFLFQLFVKPNIELGGLIRSFRVTKSKVQPSVLPDESLGSLADILPDIVPAKHVVDTFLSSVKSLLYSSVTMKEDSYLLFIKAISALNGQIPLRYLIGSTEIAEMCAACQFNIDQSPVNNVNVSEGLLHILNDIGYPQHMLPEAIPCLQLCIDLINTTDFGGFFYVNDIKILVDIIIRELTNIPLVPPPAENEGDLDDASVLGEHTGNEDSDIPACSLEEQTRQMYLKIARSLVVRSAWESIDSFYRKSEVDALCTSLLESDSLLHPVTRELITDILGQ